MTELTVMIPGTIDAKLTGNSRAHHMAKYRLGQDLFFRASYSLIAATRPDDPAPWFPRDSYPITLDYYVAWESPRRKIMDDDNLIIGFKKARDGIASVLCIDDKHFRTGTITQDYDPDGKGYIRVTIRSAAEKGQVA